MTRSPASWLIALAALLPMGAMADAHGSRDGQLRAMTYNIRLDLPSDGPNGWPHRKELVAAVIRREAPDIIGMQEVLLAQKQDLEAALPEYAMVGGARDDGKEKGEFSPLAYRRDRFALVDSGTIWLSETPLQPGRAWDAAFPRIATWARLRDLGTGQVIRLVNTHFDHVGIVARSQSASMLSQWLANGEWAGLPTIVMGDLNSEPDGDGYRRLVDGPAGLRDTRLASRKPPYGPAGTFNAFRIDGASGAPIDHIFVSEDFAVESHAVVTQHWNGRLPSDHYPVVADLSRGGE